MAKKQNPVKVEKNLALRPVDEGKWEMVIYKPQKRKILYGTLAEVTVEATEIYRSATGGSNTNPTLSEAMLAALADGTANEETLVRYTRETNKFLEWFKTAYPGITQWKHVRPSMVQAYCDSLKKQGRARDSVRLAVFPIKKTSLFWHNDYPRVFDHITRKLKLPEQSKAPNHALTLEQLESVLAWLRDNRPALYPIIALSGYMGMRLREPTGILNGDIDLKAGTIRVQENDVRDIKNSAHSQRVIPLTAKAREALEHYMATATVKTIRPDEPAFLDEKGNPWHLSHFGPYCRQVKKSMTAKVELPSWFTFDCCRPTFNTLMINAGAREAFTDAYQGRRPQTIGRMHYQAITLEDLQREVVAVFDRLCGIDIPTNTTIQPPADSVGFK